MEVVYLLVVLAAVLAGVILWAFFWSVKSGQFDDLEGPAYRILMEQDEARARGRDRASDGRSPRDPKPSP